MKRYFLPVFFVASMMGQAPQLGIADEVAISSLEQVKQDAQKKYVEASQQEASILREWEAAHPGYTLNPQTFAVEAETKPAKPEVKK